MIPSVLLAGSAGVGLGAALVDPRRRPLSRPRVWLSIAAIASAVAATYADGSVTGWEPLDVAARATLGGAIVLLGALTPARTMMVSALATLVAATGAAVQPVAAAAVGLLVPAVVSHRLHPWVTTIAGGMVVQVALRLSEPDITGITVLIALVVLAPIALSGVSKLDGAVRRKLVRVGVLLGAFTVLGTGAALAAAVVVRPSMSRGLGIVTQEVVEQGGGPERASDRLFAARRDFRRARRILDSWWVRPAAAVPVVGQHWRALRAGALSGEQLADLGVDTARSFNLGGLYVTNGTVPLQALADLEPALDRAWRDLSDVRSRLRSADSPWLIPSVSRQLDDARARVASAEAGARTAVRVLPQLPALLGSQHPRRYFLAVQTPAELRASGGFMGNYGEITAEQGTLRLTRFGSIVDLMGGDLSSRRLVAAPDYTERYSRFRPAEEWGNVNLSPDFPTNAKVIAGLYPQSGGEPIDGVVAVDPAGLASLLRVVGPLTVRQWPIPLTADNITRVLLREQYARFDQQLEREAFLTEVTEGVWGKLTTGSFPVSRLMGSLGPAIDGKHLQLWSSTGPEQRLFEDLGAAGAMDPVEGDFLGVVTQNAGASKLDVFLRRQVDYRVELDPADGELRARLRLTLHNDAPRSGLPAYVIGETTPPVPPGDNRLYLSIYTPWDLAGVRIDGKDAVVDQERELGRQVYSSFLVVPGAGRSVIELDLTGRLANPQDYRLTLHRQPTAAPDEVETTLAVPFGWRVGGLVGTEASEHLRLEADRTLEFPVRRQW